MLNVDIKYTRFLFLPNNNQCVQILIPKELIDNTDSIILEDKIIEYIIDQIEDKGFFASKTMEGASIVFTQLPIFILHTVDTWRDFLIAIKQRQQQQSGIIVPS